MPFEFCIECIINRNKYISNNNHLWEKLWGNTTLNKIYSMQMPATVPSTEHPLNK